MSDKMLKASMFLSKLFTKALRLIAIPIGLLLLFVGGKLLLESTIAFLHQPEVGGNFEAGAVYGGVISGPICIYLAYRSFKAAYGIFKN